MMLSLRRYLPAALALACLASAMSCVYYTEIPEAGNSVEAGVQPDASGSSSGASGGNGFQKAPAFAPSFDNDSGTGVRVYSSSCQTPSGSSALTDGTYRYRSGCMDQNKFVEQLPTCAGATVLKSLAKIDGVVNVSGGGTYAQRTGSLLYAIDIVLPCRQTNSNGQCSNLANALVVGLGDNQTPAVVNCYDVSETDCQCQVQVSIDLGADGSVGTGTFFNDKNPFWVDQLGALTVTRNFRTLALYPEATGFWKLTK